MNLKGAGRVGSHLASNLTLEWRKPSSLTTSTWASGKRREEVESFKVVRELEEDLLVMFEPPLGEMKEGVGEGERMGSISVVVGCK